METDAPAILIVDDNEDNRYTLQLLLESDGHSRLATASGGHEAVALLARQKFSWVLLDLIMPDLKGEDVLKIIKGNPDTRDVSVVVLSADTDTEMVSKCIELGADDYLSKPFNPTILRARVSSELSKRSLRSMENEYRERIEQEKKHSEALLRNILPPEIAIRLRKGRPILQIISTMPPSYSRMWSVLPTSRRACGHLRSCHVSIACSVNLMVLSMTSAPKRSKRSATATWWPSAFPLRAPTTRE